MEAMPRDDGTYRRHGRHRRRIVAIASVLALGGGALAVRPGDAAGVAPLLLESPAGPGSLRLVNPGGAAVEVAGPVAVEWRDTSGGVTWRPVSTEFNVVERCQRPPPAAVRLGPGQSVTVVPWRGYSCSGQCNMTCRANISYGPGVFRPVVTVLPTGERVVGPEWVLSGRSLDR